MEGGWLAYSTSTHVRVGKESIALHMSSIRKTEHVKSLSYPHWENKIPSGAYVARSTHTHSLPTKKEIYIGNFGLCCGREILLVGDMGKGIELSTRLYTHKEKFLCGSFSEERFWARFLFYFVLPIFYLDETCIIMYNKFETNEFYPKFCNYIINKAQ